MFLLLPSVSASGQNLELTKLPLEATSLIYSERHDRLVASISSTAAAYANSILLIDPVSGEVVDSLLVGNEPTLMALSRDNQVLYVASAFVDDVVKVNLDAWSIEGTISLPASEDGQSLHVFDIDVQPGNPDVFAVSMQFGNSSSSRLSIYDDGELRNTTVRTEERDIEFGADSTTLYGYDVRQEYSKFNVTPEGVVLVSRHFEVLSGFMRGLEFAGGHLFSAQGYVADPLAAERLGFFGKLIVLNEPVDFVPEPAVGRTYFLISGRFNEPAQLIAFNNNSFGQIASQPLEESIIEFRHPYIELVLWGERGFAYTNQDGDVVIFTSQLRAPSLAGLNLSESTIDMGLVDGDTDVPVLIENAGNAELKVDSVVSSNSVFSFSPPSFVVEPGDYVSGILRYVPQRDERSGSTMQFYSNSVSSPAVLQVWAGARVRSLRTDVDSLNFEDVQLEASKDLLLFVESNFLFDLDISRIYTTNERFSISGDTSAFIPRSGSKRVDVTFRPDSIKTEEGFLVIESTAVSSPDSIPLLGNGVILADLVLANRNIVFGEVSAGTPRDTTFQVLNAGTDTLRVSSINSSDGAFTPTPTTFELIPGDSMGVMLSFLSAQTGSNVATLTIESNAPSSPDEVFVAALIVVTVSTESYTLPAEFALKQSYPNPVQLEATIPFDLPESSPVTLYLYNSLGQKMATLIDQTMPAGSHAARFDVRNLPSGLYVYTLISNSGREGKTLMVTK